jgi:6-pyruvoyltetrahydropterin/6-carboxytetrahydropterin synthase
MSTKTYGHEVGLTATFRQWRAKSHCRFMHGYALKIKLVFMTHDAGLDMTNWVVDFGALKSLRKIFEDTFDHKTLVAKDDPDFELFEIMHDAGIIQLIEVPNTGCEAFAKLVHDITLKWMHDAGFSPRVTLVSVEVAEHGANSAIYGAA